MAGAAVARARREHLVRPAGLRDLVVLVGERAGDRLGRAARSYREDLERPSVVDDGLVAQAVDELAPDAGVDRGDEVEPEAREARRQHWHRNHVPAEAAAVGVLVHQVEVRADVGAADLEHLAPVRLVVERREEVGEHVLDRDRLRARAHPAWRDHHRQPLDERAEHLERRAPRADHDRGAELDRRHARRRAGSARPRASRRGALRGRPRRGRRGRRSCAHLRPVQHARTPRPPCDRPPRRSRPTPSSGRGSRRSRPPRAPGAASSGATRRRARPRCQARRAPRGTPVGAKDSERAPPGPRARAADGRRRSPWHPSARSVHPRSQASRAAQQRRHGGRSPTRAM